MHRQTAVLGQWLLGSLSPCLPRRGDLAPKLVDQCLGWGRDDEGGKVQPGQRKGFGALCSASSPVPEGGAGAGSEMFCPEETGVGEKSAKRPGKRQNDLKHPRLQLHLGRRRVQLKACGPDSAKPSHCPLRGGLWLGRALLARAAHFASGRCLFFTASHCLSRFSPSFYVCVSCFMTVWGKRSRRRPSVLVLGCWAFVRLLCR